MRFKQDNAGQALRTNAVNSLEIPHLVPKTTQVAYANCSRKGFKPMDKAIGVEGDQRWKVQKDVSSSQLLTERIINKALNYVVAQAKGKL